MASSKPGRVQYCIPRTVVDPWRRHWYDLAWQEARRKDRNLNFSDWLRASLDRAAARELPQLEDPETLGPPEREHQGRWPKKPIKA